MIHYILTHLGVSLLLSAAVFLLPRSKTISNRTQLNVLYVLLAKSLIPWGVIDIPLNIWRAGDAPNGFSYEASLQRIGEGTGALPSNLPIEILASFFWIGISAGIIILTARNLLKLHGRIRTARPSDDIDVNELFERLKERLNPRKSISVKISEEVSSPIVWRDRSWLIVLPREVLSLSVSDKKSILAHELIHIRNNDFIKFLFLKLVKSVFFFSPFVWIVVDEIVNAKEIETDKAAMDVFQIVPESFGKAILNFFSNIKSRNYPIPSLIGSTRRRLATRVEKLFHLAKITKSGTSGKILFVLGMLSFSLVNCSSLKGMPQNTSFLINPVPSGKITLDYGFANHPITKERFKHSGVDLAANAGTPILASGDGIVIAADTNDQTGNFILIAHEDGIETFYSHMDKVLVMKGRQVPKGGKIGAVGSTGVSTGPHLHFEIRRDGHAIDPHTMVTFD